MKRSFFALVAALLLLVTAIPAVAQEQTSSIEGTIVDGSGAALPGVSVEAASAKGQKYSAQTDASGKYRFPSIPPGSYTVTATLAGMEPAQVKNVNAGLGASPKVDLTLKIGAVTEQITVTAEAPLVDTTSSATATSISSETFEKLPKGRDFSTVVTQAASANFETKQGAGGTGGISIDGASGSENVFVVDGVNTTNPQTGVQGKIVITDFVEEVQVKSAGYQAEFGGAIGGVINVVTKTGTNDFRGALGLNYTDNEWNGDNRPVLKLISGAPTYVLYEKDDQTITEPTLALGGPILRDRLWFFGAYSPSMRDTTRDGANQDFTRQNWAATVNGSLGAKFLFKFSGNNSGYEQDGVITTADRTGVVAPNETLERENWAYSGYADFIASPEWYFSARGGRYYDNQTQGGVSAAPIVNFRGGSNCAFVGNDSPLCKQQGFNSAPGNSAITEDSYQRDNFDADVSWFPTFAGTHRFKGGVQFTNLENNVESGNQNYYVRTYWNGQDPFAGAQGTYGNAGVYVFKTLGQVKSKNTGFYVQDSWTTMNDRLTLNLGVRTEQEKVPSYADPALGLAEYAIEFDYQDKLAPRFGFAYDLFGTGRTKVFGSYGKYYDITKMEMPRGSFGGDKWIWFDFKIEDPDWTKWQCSNVTTKQSDVPTCTGGLVYAGRATDLRHPSLELIEPDLKPMESEEFAIGGQHELNNQLALGIRYVNKHLVRTIEDVGVLVCEGSDCNEEYFIANPGFGVADKILAGTCPTCPGLPKAKRDYQALELEATKRFGNRWGAHASYVYSELEGNYGGLASSDENGRNSPNVNRYFDNLFNSFDANGDAVEGKLATDRPHVFKAQVTYQAPWGTGFGLNQYIGSGTPISTQFYYYGVPFFAYGRGDLGRTPTLRRTDLAIQHEFRIAGRYGFEVGLNVLNLLDSDTAVNINNDFSTRNVAVNIDGDEILDDATFFNGFNPEQYMTGVDKNGVPKDFRNKLYGQENQFQDPREIRLFAKFRF
jgi:hypothetical protein